MSPRAEARVRWGVLIAFGLCGAVVACGWLRSRATSRTVTLANGVVLRAVAVSYGTNHVVQPGGALGGVFGEWIGFFKPSLARPRSFNYSSPTPTLAVFLQKDAASARGLNPVAMRVRLEDELGVTAGEQRWIEVGTGGSGGINQVEFEAVPHGSHTLRLAFQTAEDFEGARRELGSFTFANPAFRNRSQPSAGAFPATATNSELEVTLRNLVFGVSSATHAELGSGASRIVRCEPALRRSEPHALGVFQFREASSNTTAWAVENVEVSTVVGDRLEVRSSSRHRAGPLQILTFGPVPWPDEPWQLDVWVTRNPPAVVDAHELLTLEAVAVPPPGQTNFLCRVARFGYTPLRAPTKRRMILNRENRVVVLVNLFIHRAPSDPRGPSSNDLSRLILEVPELPAGYCLDLIRAVDEQGQALEPGTTTTTPGRPMRIEYGFLQVPEGAKTLEFTLALQRARVLRLTARPVFAGTNGFVLAGGE